MVSDDLRKLLSEMHTLWIRYRYQRSWLMDTAEKTILAAMKEVKEETGVDGIRVEFEYGENPDATLEIRLGSQWHEWDELELFYTSKIDHLANVLVDLAQFLEWDDVKLEV